MIISARNKQKWQLSLSSQKMNNSWKKKKLIIIMIAKNETKPSEQYSDNWNTNGTSFSHKEY